MPDPAWILPPAVLIAAALLAGVHAAAPVFRAIEGLPRRTALSVAGGVAVAYVILHLLPELADGQRHVAEVLGSNGYAAEGEGSALSGLLSRLVYIVALAGLAAFYGVEKLALDSSSRDSGGRAKGGTTDERAGSGTGVFWIHIASFAAYDALIGYLLVHRERSGAGDTFAFAVAMALHFVVNDFALYEHHQQRFQRVGRWILTGAVLAGVTLGASTGISRAAVAIMTAFLAGGVILNVLKEEVPSEREGRFWAFGAGMLGFSILLLL